MNIIPKKTLIFIFSASILLLFGACSGDTESNSNSSDTEKIEQIKEFIEEEFEYPLPTSFQITKMLNEASAVYDYSILNDPKKATEYNTVWKKATNLGVYGADLSYSATFEKAQETINFLDASRRLIEDLNITMVFNEKFVARIESNIENVDSLIVIVTESFYDTYNYLNQNAEEKTSILVIAGSVIEGLYITCELIKKSDKKDELVTVLTAQKENVSKLVELIEKFKEDRNVSRIIPSLRYINLVFEQLGAHDESVLMTDGQFSDIYGSVTSIREQIVNM